MLILLVQCLESHFSGKVFKVSKCWTKISTVQETHAVNTVLFTYKRDKTSVNKPVTTSLVALICD